MISPTGINGTVGGDIDDLRKYVKYTKKYPGFKKIAFKWSQGTGNEFPKLYVAVKKELVAFEDYHKIRQLKYARTKYNNRLAPKPVYNQYGGHLARAGAAALD